MKILESVSVDRDVADLKDRLLSLAQYGLGIANGETKSEIV